MSGEFNVTCLSCGVTLVVCAPPTCPQCHLDAMLCDDCMPEHDCKDAKEEAKRWERFSD
jgi:hypothetical protein